MNLKIVDVMAKRVIFAEPHHTVEHVRGLLQRNRIHALPVVGSDGELHGIVTSADLANKLKNDTPVSRIMTRDVRAVPAYNDASVAARIMRKHKIHHVVVTHEKQVVGMISSFDLLKLIEGHRFAVKSAPSTPKRRRLA
jgi:CBS domain-containing protein